MLTPLKKGFTLVEVIVVGLLIAILGIGIVSVISWTSEETSRGNLESHLQAQSAIVRESIARRVRSASAIAGCAESETFTKLIQATDLTSTGSTTCIRLIDASGTSQGTYAIDASHILQEDGTHFVIDGERDVILSESSSFQLHSGRKTVGISLTFYASDSKQTLSRLLQVDTLQTRN